VLGPPFVKEVCPSPAARTIHPSLLGWPAAELSNGMSLAASLATDAGSGNESPAAATRGIGSATASAVSARERYETAAVITKPAELQAER